MKKRTVFLLLGALCLLAALGLTVWNLQTAGRAQIAAAAAVQQLEPLIAAPAQEAAQTPDAKRLRGFEHRRFRSTLIAAFCTTSLRKIELLTQQSPASAYADAGLRTYFSL